MATRFRTLRFTKRGDSESLPVKVMEVCPVISFLGSVNLASRHASGIELKTKRGPKWSCSFDEAFGGVIVPNRPPRRLPQERRVRVSGGSHDTLTDGTSTPTPHHKSVSILRSHTDYLRGRVHWSFQSPGRSKVGPLRLLKSLLHQTQTYLTRVWLFIRREPLTEHCFPVPNVGKLSLDPGTD